MSRRETGCEAPILILSFFGESVIRRPDAATCSQAQVCRRQAAGRATFWTHLVCAKDGVAPVLEATIRWRKRELTTVHHRIRASVGVAEVKVTGFLLRGRGEWPEVIAELGLVGVKRLQPEILTSKEDKTVLSHSAVPCPGALPPHL